MSLFSRFTSKINTYLLPYKKLSALEYKEYVRQENQKIRDHILLLCLLIIFIYPFYGFFLDKNLVATDVIWLFKIFRIVVAAMALTCYLFYLKSKKYENSSYKFVFLMMASSVAVMQSVMLIFFEKLTTLMPFIIILVLLYVIKLKPLSNMALSLLLVAIVSFFSYIAGIYTFIILNNIIITLVISILFSMRNYTSIRQYKLNKSLQNSLAQKNTFLYRTQNQLIHDVKSPLTTIKFVADKETNNLLKLATERVENIIFELENEDKISSNNIRVSILINQVIKEAQIRYNIKNSNKFSFSQEIKVSDDQLSLRNISENQLSRALSNVINNSIEANLNTGCEINILIFETNHNLNITIKDNGVGVSRTTLNNILNEGYTTKEDGRGLGLHYLNELVKNNRGDLKIRSNNNFNIYIKLKKKINR